MEAVIGWIGAGLYILAYLLLSLKKIRPDKLPYQAMNIAGGLCLIGNAWHTADYPSLVTNAIWACIGVFAVYYNLLR